jgi:uncharacterized protein
MLATFFKHVFSLAFGLLCVVQSLTAQEEKSVYYDQEKKYLKEKYHVSYANPRELQGLYESYYVTGNKQMMGNYSRGTASGLWEYYYESGGIKMKGYLENGIPFGKWEYFYESGKKSMQGSLFGEVRGGNWTFYFEHGDIKSEGAFNNGERQGIWNYFYEDGTLKAQAFYENGTGIYKEFYPSGQLKAQGLNKGGKSEGKWVYYFEDGSKQAEGIFREGERIGDWKYFHANGEISAEGAFEAGTKEGNWKYYHEDGTVSAEGNLADGKKDGSWKLFERDGQTKGSVLYRDGFGTYTEYFESGKIKVKGDLKDDVKVGQWYYYFESGALEGECFFTEGVGIFRGYYENGTLKMEGEVRNGDRVGEWKLYHEDGSLAGLYRPIYEDDKPVFRLSETEDLLPDRVPYDKPEYKFKNRNSRYFTPRVGEYKGWIFATNPLAPVLGVLPVSVEHYSQERLGYEFQFIYLKQPFFKGATSVRDNKLFLQGSRIKLRQKFYDSDNLFGMFYFGQEVAFTSIDHRAHIIDSTGVSNRRITIGTQEQKIEYGLFLGNRWLSDPGGSGFTVDAYIGAGIGYRLLRKNYQETAERNNVFSDLNQSNISFPIIIGVNIGFLVGPKNGPGFFVN